MKNLDCFMQLYTLGLITLILGNIARLVSDYLITKFK